MICSWSEVSCSQCSTTGYSYKCWSDVKSACASSIVSWFQGQQLHSRWDDTSPKVCYSSLFLLQTGKNQITGVTIFKWTTTILKYRSEFNISHLRLIYMVWLLIKLPSCCTSSFYTFRRNGRQETNKPSTDKVKQNISGSKIKCMVYFWSRGSRQNV